ncbi:MAG TPA: hypothetical protein GYA05_01745 [Acholeplasmataceae bacterium]|nr:hypothetical protein [Acholeplasmataceae bacterium]
MHAALVIVSEHDPKDIFQGIDHLWVKPPRKLKGKYTLEPGITFDCLIFSDLETLGDEEVLMDGGLVVTNFYFQTSREDLFCVGPLNGSSLKIEEQYERIKEFLMNPI